MKAKINGIELEGTPKEITEYLKLNEKSFSQHQKEKYYPKPIDYGEPFWSIFPPFEITSADQKTSHLKTQSWL